MFEIVFWAQSTRIYICFPLKNKPSKVENIMTETNIPPKSGKNGEKKPNSLQNGQNTLFKVFPHIFGGMFGNTIIFSTLANFSTGNKS